MAKQDDKKKETGAKDSKHDYRIVMDTPAFAKISDRVIEKAVEKAVLNSSPR